MLSILADGPGWGDLRRHGRPSTDERGRADFRDAHPETFERLRGEYRAREAQALKRRKRSS